MNDRVWQETLAQEQTQAHRARYIPCVSLEAPRYGKKRIRGYLCARKTQLHQRDANTHITPQQPPRAHVGVRKCCMQARESMWQYTGIDVSANMYEDLYWAIMYRQHAACTASNSHALTPSRACIMHLSSRMRGCAHADQLSQKSVLPDFRVIPL